MTPVELVAHARKQMADLMHVLPMGVYNTMDMLCDLLSSDARPAPMVEEVKAALADLRRLVPSVYQCHDAAQVLSAYIDHLTRKVAEERQVADEACEHAKEIRDEYAQYRVAHPSLSRPRETDAVLAAATATEAQVKAAWAAWREANATGNLLAGDPMEAALNAGLLASVHPKEEGV